MTGVAWFVDGSYAYKCWRNVAGMRQMDYAKFRVEIEADARETISDAYYFNADNDPPSAQQNSFHKAIGKRPSEGGPGLNVKLGSLEKKRHYWPDQMGGKMITHPESGEPYETKSQKEVDVLLAYYLSLSFQTRRWARLYLVAGDRDFYTPIKRLRENEGVEIIIFGVKGGISKLNGKRYKSSISEKYDAITRAYYFEDFVEQIAMEPISGAGIDYEVNGSSLHDWESNDA